MICNRMDDLKVQQVDLQQKDVLPRERNRHLSMNFRKGIEHIVGVSEDEDKDKSEKDEGTHMGMVEVVNQAFKISNKLQ